MNMTNILPWGSPSQSAPGVLSHSTSTEFARSATSSRAAWSARCLEFSRVLEDTILTRTPPLASIAAVVD